MSEKPKALTGPASLVAEIEKCKKELANLKARYNNLKADYRDIVLLMQKTENEKTHLENTINYLRDCLNDVLRN